ncbi:MAG: MTH938/NDUFAF3 family protein [Deltaproteobacteria bacterium]|nr:MTH938/NDUFAF3 family protein [Deltaproteobacteria bacterium]
MQIDQYRFGNITINGDEYTDDLIIIDGEKIIVPWIREKGHLCQKKDIDNYLNESTKKVVFARGYFWIMKIDDELKKYLSENNIEFVELNSKRAVDLFNSIEDKKGLLFCIHLTC